MIVFLLNLFLLMAGSSGAVPFGIFVGTSKWHTFADHLPPLRDNAPHHRLVVRYICTIICYWSILWNETRSNVISVSNGTITHFPFNVVSHPVRVNPIPRQIPPTPRYLQPWVIIIILIAPPSLTLFQAAMLLSGILPFGETIYHVDRGLSGLIMQHRCRIR